MDTYQNDALRTLAKGTSSEQLEHGILGLVTESAELADILKRHKFYGKSLDSKYIKEELGDLLWYAAVLAHAIGTNLSDVAKINLSKLEARYPKDEGFSTDRALNRDTEAELDAMEGAAKKPI